MLAALFFVVLTVVFKGVRGGFVRRFLRRVQWF